MYERHARTHLRPRLLLLLLLLLRLLTLPPLLLLHLSHGLHAGRLPGRVHGSQVALPVAHGARALAGNVHGRRRLTHQVALLARRVAPNLHTVARQTLRRSRQQLPGP
jgi:hypothetical protein